jgi:hypothetical protein
MIRKILSSVVLMVAIAGPIQAQSFLPPLESMPLSQNAYLSLKSGVDIEGKITYITSGRGVNKVALKDKDGNKHQYKAADIYEFGIFSNGMTKLQYFNESAGSIKAALKTDRSAVKLNDYVVYRNASLKGGKVLLLQLLNPHFDEKIQVYHAANARKTSTWSKGPVTITGDMQRVYLVSKEGAPTFKVKKGSYRKSYRKLFEDCPEMNAIKSPKFKDFGKHIYHYTEMCSGGTYYVKD